MTTGDAYTLRVAEDMEEATKLLEAWFEYMTDFGDRKIFAKRLG